MSQSSKTVVVTGGCGYIGSQVAKELKKNDYNVIIVDNVKRDHTLKYADKFILSDYADENALEIITQENPCAIVHCAGTSLVGPSMANPGEYYLNNVSKTIQMLSYLQEHCTKMPAIIFSSSASVYGNPVSIPISENHPIQPMSPYGKTKVMIEQVLEDYTSAYGLKYVALRYFNACGADLESELGQAPGATHIIARVLESKLNNQTFTLYGDDYVTEDGTCIRDYIHVQDLADAHVKAIQYLLDRNESSRAMNLGTRVGISNKEIIDYVTENIGPFEVKHGLRRAGDPDILIADPNVANQILRWKPKYSDLPTIVDTAEKWYKTQTV